MLLADGQRGHVTLYRSRPVDDLFLRAVQQRILSIYRVCVGPAAVEPDIETTVLGEAVPGPYEPPRSLLATPILCEGRVSGVVAVASVFPEAFRSKDLCTLSSVAAQVAEALVHARLDQPGPVLDDGTPAASGIAPQGRVWSQVSTFLTSVSDLERHWQARGNGDVPEALVQDLSSIAENARQIRELLAY
jgi:hypothetical protein